jgi:hypothetical protein
MSKLKAVANDGVWVRLIGASGTGYEDGDGGPATSVDPTGWIWADLMSVVLDVRSAFGNRRVMSRAFNEPREPSCSSCPPDPCYQADGCRPTPETDGALRNRISGIRVLYVSISAA